MHPVHPLRFAEPEISQLPLFRVRLAVTLLSLSLSVYLKLFRGGIASDGSAYERAKRKRDSTRDLRDERRTERARSGER